MQNPRKARRVPREGFGEGFPPETIAIVGVSRHEGQEHPGYTGLKLLRMLREAGFQGRVYPVNPKAKRIDGLKVYPSLASIPERLDLVTITVPADGVPEVLEECAEVGAQNVQICTSGFGETGQAEEVRLESRIREIGLREGLRVIGPNCMGFHVPSIRMKMFEDVRLVGGPVAFVTQSGGHARIFLLHGPDYGLGFSKVISYGNAVLLDAPDFLEYLAGDPETEIICLYLEGIRDGATFTRIVRELSPVKPVIVWKGGLTSSGARAARSHTGSLGGDREIWDAFFKQTGAIRVGSVDEMAEVAMTLLRLKPLPHLRAAVLAAGGGSSVATGDICAEEGLELQPLSPQSIERLLEFVWLVNQGVSNPLDLPSVLMDVSNLRRALEVLGDDPMVDMVVLRLGAEFFAGPLAAAATEFRKHILSFTGDHSRGKPVVIALSDEGQVRETEKYARELREAGILTFDSLRRACRALRRFTTYHQFVAEVGTQRRE